MSRFDFLWINKDPLPKGTPLFGTKEQTAFQARRLSEWARLNPNSPIQLWYDSAMVGSESLANTRKILADSRLGQQAVLRDIRTLEYTRTFPEMFDPKVPIYFRVDLAKGLVADRAVSDGKTISVFADLDVQAVPRQYLLQQSYHAQLKKHGFLMSSNAGAPENSFIMLDGRNTAAVEKHRKHLLVDVAKEFYQKEKGWLSHTYVFGQYGSLRRDLDGTNAIAKSGSEAKAPERKSHLLGLEDQFRYQRGVQVAHRPTAVTSLSFEPTKLPEADLESRILKFLRLP